MYLPIITDFIHNGKKYFHLTCACRYLAKDEGYVFYSVVHEWEKLNEWEEHLKSNHTCRQRRVSHKDAME